jgi:Zn-dependent membrane protease YugP
MVAALFARFWRELTIVVLTGACYILYTRPAAPCPTASEKVAEEIVEEENVQTVTVVVTKPDGTKTEKTTKTEKNTKVSEKVSDKVKVGAVTKTRYEVSVAAPVGEEYQDVRVGVGARIGDLPLFGTVDYRIKSKEVMVGLRLEF